MTTASGSWSAMTTAREERKPLTNQGTTLRRRFVRRSRGETDALANSDAREPDSSTAQVSRLGELEQMDDLDEKKPKERTHSG